jgi:hypothetical protein
VGDLPAVGDLLDVGDLYLASTSDFVCLSLPNVALMFLTAKTWMLFIF